MNAEFIKNLLFLVGLGVFAYLFAVASYRVVQFVWAAFFGTTVTIVVKTKDGERKVVRMKVPRGDDLLEAIDRADRSRG